RLNVFPIVLPPLRQRREDIPLLVTHFAEKFSRRMRRPIHRIPPETMSAFQLHSWPGNVRELQNIVERAVILSTDGTLPTALQPSQSQTPAPATAALPRQTTLKDSERALIIEALESVGWVVGGAAGAAAKLGLKRTTLIHKMKKHGISRPSARGISE